MNWETYLAVRVIKLQIEISISCMAYMLQEVFDRIGCLLSTLAMHEPTWCMLNGQEGLTFM